MTGTVWYTAILCKNPEDTALILKRRWKRDFALCLPAISGSYMLPDMRLRKNYTGFDMRAVRSETAYPRCGYVKTYLPIKKVLWVRYC